MPDHLRFEHCMVLVMGVYVIGVVAVEQASSETVVETGQRSSGDEAASEIPERLPALLPRSASGKRADQSGGAPLA